MIDWLAATHKIFLDKYVTPILQISLIGKYENTLEISTSGE